jgi:hypothetical protein
MAWTNIRTSHKYKELGGEMLRVPCHSDGKGVPLIYPLEGTTPSCCMRLIWSATPMFRNLAIRKTEHVPGKVSLDRSIEEQYDLLDLEERLLQAGRGIVLKC